MTQITQVKLLVNLNEKEDSSYQSKKENLIRLGNLTRYILNSSKFIDASAAPKNLYVSDLYNLSEEKILDICFKTCSNVRRNDNIDAETYVVIITDKLKNAKWYSRFDNNRNIVIRENNFQLYTEVSLSYPLAYEALCSILRIQMGIGNSSASNSLWHKKPKGCINDLCLDPYEVNLKLKTADICPTCREHLTSVDKKLVEEAFKLFEMIRTNVITPKRTNYPDVFIYESNIWLDYIDVKMTPLEKTIYNFFLVHPEGVLANSLVNFQEELYQIYLKYRPSGAFKTIQKLTDYKDNSLFENVSRINKKLAEILQKDNAHAYLILKGEQEKLKIRLSKNKIRYMRYSYENGNKTMFSLANLK